MKFKITKLKVNLVGFKQCLNKLKKQTKRVDISEGTFKYKRSITEKQIDIINNAIMLNKNNK